MTKKQTSMERVVSAANEVGKRKAAVAHFKRNPQAAVAKLKDDISKLGAGVAKLKSVGASVDSPKASRSRATPDLRALVPDWDKLSPAERLEKFREAKRKI